MARIDELERGLVDQYGEQVLAELKDGKEYGDPVPKAPPVHLTRPLSLSEQIRQMVRRENADAYHAAGVESFDEADDFDIPDEPLDPHTPYEAVFDPPPPAAKEELKNGDASGEQGRASVARDGSGKSREVVKDKSEPQSDVQGSGSKAGGADPKPQE